jgi:hypothetical protein
MGACAADYDNDDRVDLYVTTLGPDVLFHNEGHGNFSDATRSAGVGSETHSLFRSLGGGLFADATFESGLGPATLPFLGFGVAFLDYDNDTDLDLAIANGHVLDNADLFRSTSRYAQRNLLLRNEGEGPLRRGRPALQPWIAHGEGQSDHRRRGYRQRRRP